MLSHFNLIRIIEVSQNIEYLVQNYESKGLSGSEKSLYGFISQFNRLEEKINDSLFIERFNIRREQRAVVSQYWMHLAAISKVEGDLEKFEEYRERAVKGDTRSIYDAYVQEIL